ncbi:MAG TPA: hypothetical protein VNG53_07250 [Bacteroidia bacterium]|nr:hypothetical protein [Bacteroidia bacterium]
MKTPTEETIYDCIEKFSNINAETLSTITGINKMLVFKTVKNLAEKNCIKISDTKPTTYKALKSVEVKTLDKKAVKVVTPKEEIKEAAKKVEKKVKKEEEEKDELVFNSEGRNTDKLKFNGELYGKGRLGLAVAKKYMQDNPQTTIAKLKEVFPDELNKRYGFFQTVDKAKKISGDRDRYFLKPEDLIKVDNKKIAICNQFGSHNLPLKHFKSLGFVIK